MLKKNSFWATLLTLMLALVLVFTLVACGDNYHYNDDDDDDDDERVEDVDDTKKPSKKVNPDDPTVDVSIYTADGFEASTLKNQVSWEGINSFKSTREIAELYKTDPTTAIEEARQVAVEFFTYAKTATWIPADNWDFTHHGDGTGPDQMIGGQVYGGLPYVGLGSGSIYRLLDFMDPNTGVVDIYSAGGTQGTDGMATLQLYFGNQCANGAYQGWSRVINSANYNGTPRMTLANGFIPVGNYTYPTYTTTWSVDYNTVAVCRENGDQVMWESYAQLQPGDGLVNFTTAGHVMMVVSEPVVVRKADGTIDGNQSYLYITDQHVQFSTYTHPDGGDTCQAARYVERKFTFANLSDEKAGYIPFTYKEWLGEDPIEAPEYNISHSGETITLEQLFKTKITSNYHIYDIYASIYNADGVEVAKIATHSDSASTYELKFMKAGITSVIWGDLDKLDPAKYEYTVKIYMQSGTGDRPILWEGKLAAE